MFESTSLVDCYFYSGSKRVFVENVAVMYTSESFSFTVFTYASPIITLQLSHIRVDLCGHF